MNATVALDVLVAGLLVATIVYATILNRRLSQLRGGREQMERLVNDFYQATTRAELGATALKEAAGHSDTEVLEQLESLTKLRNELDFLVDRAEAQSARLEELVATNRDLPAHSPLEAERGSAPDAGLDAELFGAADARRDAGDRRQHPFRPMSAPRPAALEEQ